MTLSPGVLGGVRGDGGAGKWGRGQERRHHINVEVEQMSNLSRSCLLFHPNTLG